MQIDEDGTVLSGNPREILRAIAETAAQRMPMTIQGTDYLALRHGERLMIVGTLRIAEMMGMRADELDIRESAFWAGELADRIEQFDQSVCGHDHEGTAEWTGPRPDDTPTR